MSINSQLDTCANSQFPTFPAAPWELVHASESWELGVEGASAIHLQPHSFHQRDGVAARHRSRLHPVVELELRSIEPVLEVNIGRTRRRVVGDCGDGEGV